MGCRSCREDGIDVESKSEGWVCGLFWSRMGSLEEVAVFLLVLGEIY